MKLAGGRFPPTWRGREVAMFKAFVVAFALTVSGFMLWVAHHDAHYATMHQVTSRQPV
jgi:hypothetical protein